MLHVLSLLGTAMLVFWAFGAYNRLVALRMAIGAAWTQFEEALQRREQTLAPLAVRLRGPLATEHRALDALVVAQAQLCTAADAVRAQPVQAAAMCTFNAQEAQLAAALARVLALAEQSANVREDVEASALLAQLESPTQRMAAARQWFNDAAVAYDAAIQQWPTRALVPLFGFRAAGRL